MAVSVSDQNGFILLNSAQVENLHQESNTCIIHKDPSGVTNTDMRRLTVILHKTTTA